MPLSPYLENLQNNPEYFQLAIKELCIKYQVDGSGFMDLILDNEGLINLIVELTKLPVAVHGLCPWCHCTPETKLKYGCPHGYGGPKDRSGEGWFSECVHYTDFEICNLPDAPNIALLPPEVFAEKSNELAVDYIKNGFSNEDFYSPCLYLGLWLEVPSDWFGITWDY